MSAEIPLIIPLNRPQYVPTPETLVSALAWDVLEYTDEAMNATGWRYRGAESPRKRSPILLSLPTEAHEGLQNALDECGFIHDLDGTMLAQAVTNSIAGVRAAGAKGQAASPMTPAMALLQNTVGMTGAPNPANYASILDTMFRLGGDADGMGIAAHWLRAAEERVERDPVLRALDQAVSRVRGGHQTKSPPTPALPDVQWGETPFGWLHDSWIRLTSSEWVEALPPRVWTDWAATVLRLGLAMGYLWECERYDRIVRAVIRGENCPSKAGSPEHGSPFELVPWLEAHLPATTRNVRPILRRRTDSGGRLRTLLAVWAAENEGEDPDTWLTSPHFRQAALDELAKDERPRYLQNLNETVVYSILRRDPTDHYGLLSPRGNAIAVVEPGTDWIALIASLAARKPGQGIHVGRVVKELARLGLQPSLPDLIRLLEAAGLASGSSDADHGVRVASAF